MDCILVGDGTLTQRCGTELLERGHTVRGVATENQGMARWAAQHGLACVRSARRDGTEPLRRLVAEQGCDWLFSIHNLRLLPAEVLALPRLLAVNWHDGPLPRYAGLHATSWAIFHRERSHGITWHVVRAGIDDGEVLLQKEVPIGERETACTLNAACWEAAVQSFPALLDGLERRGLDLMPQDSRRRTFFRGGQKPWPGCIVRWERPWEEIDAFCRALDFGPYENPIGLPRITTGTGVLLLGELTPEARSSGAQPGTIVRADELGIVVATGSVDVRVSALRDAAGSAVGPAELANRYGLRRGSRLLWPAASSSSEPTPLERLDARAHRHEAEWVRAVESARPFAPPPFAGAVRVASSATVVATAWSRHSVALPEMLSAHACGLPEVERAALFLVLAGSFLMRHVHRELDVAVRLQSVLRRLDESSASELYSCAVPWRVAIDESSGLDECVRAVKSELADLERRGPLPIDLVPRHPQLGRDRSWLLGLPIELDLQGTGDAPPGMPCSAEWVWQLEAERGVMHWWVTSAADAPGVEILRRRCEAFLEHAARDSGRPLRELPVLLPEDRELLRRWGRGDPRSESPLAFESVRHWMQWTPDAPAIEGPHLSLSYRGLEERVEALAGRLSRRGAAPETVVAIALGRVPGLAIAILGVLRVGAAFLVVEPDQPAESLAARLRIAGAGLLLVADPTASDGLAILETAAGGGSVRPSSGDTHSGPAPRQSSGQAGDPGARLAYVAFTSGSSGSPRGVAIEQDALGGFLRCFGRQVGLQPNDRLLQIGLPTFDLAYEEILGSLSHGATLVFAEGPAVESPRAFFERVDRLQITFLDLPTALWNRMARAALELDLPVPATLRAIVLGGERAAADVLRRWVQRHGERVEIFNYYGPTETTITATRWRVDPLWASAAPSEAPVGEPLDGVTVHVCDAHGRLAPPLCEGEVWIGGDGVARGYLGADERAAAAFVRKDLDGRDLRWFRTGDLGRWRLMPGRERAQLELSGRLDRQVKVRGIRVEPGEVEAALREHPGVRDALVVPAGSSSSDGTPEPPGSGGWELVAYVVPAPAAVAESAGSRGTEVDGAALRRFLASRLPAALVPAAVVPVAELPITERGKVDRAALPVPLREHRVGGGAHLPPCTEAETRMAALWERVLRVRPIGVGDDFFELGGDSLVAAELALAIEDELGWRISLAELFRRPTISSLCESWMAPGVRAVQSACLVPLQPHGARAPFYCVHGLGGHVLRLRGLADALAPHRPMWGLQSPGLDDDDPVPETVGDLAEHLLDLVVAHAAGRPLLLGGMSYGGFVAFEMAVRAAERGTPVELVVLLDPTLRSVPAFRLAPRRRGGVRAVRHAGRRLRLVVGGWLGRARRSLRELRGDLQPVRVPADYRHFTRLSRLHARALRSWHPRPYTGAVVFFRSGDQPESALRRFRDLCHGPLEVVAVAGSHLDILEQPRVAGLATHLEARLELAGVDHG